VHRPVEQLNEVLPIEKPEDAKPKLNAVQRAITGYYQDDEGDWVAELSCGHDQHVRHRPPFEERPWVQSAAGRSGRLRSPLDCPLCDRAELPANLRFVRTSPEWNERSLPTGLRRSHRLGNGTWGRIHVHQGRLQFSMASQPPLHHELVRGEEQAIPPEMDHEVRPVGSVRFSLDFLAVDRVDATHARAPVDQGGDPACWSGLVCPDCGAILDGSEHRSGCSGAGLT